MESFCLASIDELRVRGIFRDMLLDLIKDFPLFEQPVIKQWPEVKESYLELIKFPISLQEISDRLRDGTKTPYVFCGEVFRDLELISQNCEIFNKKESDFFKRSQAFRRQWFSQAVAIASALDFPVDANQKHLRAVLASSFPPGSEPIIPASVHASARMRRPTGHQLEQLREMLDGLAARDMAEVVYFLMRQAGVAADELGGDLTVLFREHTLQVFWEFFVEVKRRHCRALARLPEKRAREAAAPIPPKRADAAARGE